ncbi:MAG: 50S ribosomal protein L19 [Candidatus Wallbacteria bacterium]|nr:50S ribosomal protein L19 [Candidatus Wallbacteria bacterium]
MNFIEKLEQAEMAKKKPAEFKPGDTVRVHVKVVEGGKERIQVFEGIVLCRQGRGKRETFTVRKISAGVGVERVFPLFSPIVKKIQRTREGDTRRARLYYLRDRIGKAATVLEKSGGRGRHVVQILGAAEESATPEGAEAPESTEASS